MSNTKLLVVTAIGQGSRPLDKIWSYQIFRESLTTYGYDCLTLGGPDYKWPGNIAGKLVFQHSQLEQIDKSYTHVLLTDGLDAFFVAPPEEIIEKFSASGATILTASEMTCHPNSDVLRDKYSQEGHPYCYLNAGGVLARRDDYVHAIDYLVQNLERYYEEQIALEIPDKNRQRSEQCLWAQAYVSQDLPLTIDKSCSIFQTFGHPKKAFPTFKPYMEQLSRIKYDRESKRFSNTVTGEHPCHFHFNGGHKKNLGTVYRQTNPNSELYKK